MSKFIPAEQFAEMANVKVDTLYVHKHMGSLPKKVFKTTKRVPNGKKEYLYIDQDHFQKRSDFHIATLNKLHEYYFVLSRYFSDMALAELVHRVYPEHSAMSALDTVRARMWEVREARYLGTPVLTKLMWKVFRTFRHILRHIFRLKGLKLSQVDLNKLHDLGDK